MKKRILSISLSVAMLSGTLPIQSLAINNDSTAVESDTVNNAPKTSEEKIDFSKLKITSISYEVNSGVRELFIDFNENSTELINKKFLDNIENIYVNGIPFNPGEYNRRSWDEKFRIIDSEDKLSEKVGEVINEIKINMKDGGEITYKKGNNPETHVTPNPKPNPTDPDNPKEDKKIIDLNNKLEDGIYTIGFRGLNYYEPTQGSMMEETFDKNVKLTVKNGKKTVEMLNHTFGEYLLTLGIKKDNSFIDAEKLEYEGEYSGNIKRNIFKFEIDDLTKTYEAGVLVSMMGGKETDIGDYDKYQKFWLKFSGPVKKGFDKYIEPEETHEKIKQDQTRLKQALIEQGADTNKDGEISPQELENFAPIDGELDLSGLELYDISILKDLGSKITSINLTGNKLKEIPENLFNKAENLENIILSNNNLTTLHPKQFANNSNLKSVVINSNNILTLDKDTFKNNPLLESIEMSNNNIKILPEGLFSNNKKLNTLYMPYNEIESLPEDIFTGTKLEFISLSNNALQELPKSIGLESLNKLYIGTNKINKLPAELNKSKKLKVLDISSNLIEEVQKDILINIAENNGEFFASDNLIKSLPLEAIKGKTLSNIELAMNFLPDILPEEYKEFIENPDEMSKYYPQKSYFDLKITEDEENIKVKNKEPLEKLLIWSTISKDIPKNIEELNEYIKSQGKEVYELAKDRFIYRIDYKVEKKTKSGWKLLKQEVLPDSTKDSEIIVNDSDKKKGDVYKITKSISASPGVGDFYGKGIFETKYIASKGKEEQVKNEKYYEVPVRLMHAHQNQPSMGDGALIPIAKIYQKNGKSEIFINMKGLEFMNMKGHLLRLWTYPNGVSSDKKGLVEADIQEYKEDIGLGGVKKEYPSTFKIVRDNIKENEIGVRVKVDAMAEIDGKGEQDARLVFDWKNAVEKEEKPTEPTEPSKPTKPTKPSNPSEEKELTKVYDPDAVYIDGYEDGTFKPDNKITRSEMAKILAYSLTQGFKPDKNYDNNFTDINQKAWYSKIIGYLKELKLIDGYPNGKFDPDKPITRAETAKIIAKIEKLSPSNEDKFKDVNKNHWAKKDIESLAVKGYVKGYPDGTYKAEENITRAEAVTIINRILKKDVNKYENKKGIKIFKDIDKNHWAYKEIIAATNKIK